ncbi:MAG: methyltransferase domain-containing protein [Chitinophagales bacterium]
MSEVKSKQDETPGNIDATFWEERWRNKQTGWDLQTLSPPLKAYFDKMAKKDAAILIPGCGSAYEAEYLLQQGFKNITLIDIAPTLVQQLLERFAHYAGKELTIICGDFFKHTGKYDFIIEQTFFCALERSFRKAYVSKMQTLLKEHGRLAGLLFDREFPGGPPFGGCREEYLSLFSERFDVLSIEPCTISAKPRLGSEVFFEVKNKNQ